MADAGTHSSPLKKIAIVIAAEVIGGHEFQARALADDLSKLSRVTIYLNREELLPVFESADAEIEVHPGLLLTKGWLGRQVLRGIARRNRVRALLKDFDHVIVCAGSVEAGVCTSVATAGMGNVSLYLPFFYDRTVCWGKIGCIYNLILGCFGILYVRIITINRIQALLISGFMHRPTAVIPNLPRSVPTAERKRPGRILFIGRLDQQKRVPELLEWLDYPENPFGEVLIIGDGPERGRLEYMAIHARHIKVTLVGWKTPEEQDTLTDGNDLLIINSLIEGEPLVIREANSRKITVIARNIPGVRGVTVRSSRFDSRKELVLLLERAAARTLRCYPERSGYEIARQRRHAEDALLTHCD